MKRQYAYRHRNVFFASRLFETVDVVVDGNGNVKILKDGEMALTLVNKFMA